MGWRACARKSTFAALMVSRAVEGYTLEEAVTRLRNAVGLEERH
jgi:hypothetical protein